jgi:DNA (cytosine-5)-methyltransferase 1
MTVYYNEYDKHAAEWLRNLIKAGHIASGDVDERSINDVRPADLAGYTQCHFFAGIGVWSYALRLAGWPDDRPVWTGSCPCQPFSAAGKGKGGADDRHLWPVWFNLIRECQPVCVFGEQVEAAIRHGWLDLVQADMEGVGYAFGAVGLPAAGFGAPHIRQRLWFVADSSGERVRTSERGPDAGTARGTSREAGKQWIWDDGGAGCAPCELADATECRSPAGPRIACVRHSAGEPERSGMPIRLAHPTPGGLGINRSAPGSTGHAALGDAVGGVEQSGGERWERREGAAVGRVADREDAGWVQGFDGAVGAGQAAGLMGDTEHAGLAQRVGQRGVHAGAVGTPAGQEPIGPGVHNGTLANTSDGLIPQPGRGSQGRNGFGSTGADDPVPGDAGESFWSSCEWIRCRDGKWRPVEPGTSPLAHGVAGRVGRLRGYGNAIVAQVAAEVIGAFMEVNNGQGSPQG